MLAIMGGQTQGHAGECPKIWTHGWGGVGANRRRQMRLVECWGRVPSLATGRLGFPKDSFSGPPFGDDVDLDELREIKVKLPVNLHIRLQSLKIIKGVAISRMVLDALESYFEKLEAPESPKQGRP